ncbi:hypothetical protein [Cecembia lonarensis]|uniref:Uncharacterized protein n=1 Tax=Cecembia lonarensis (strain CCUG 58316 / KCTC 22772 / LW9) TaxID=1225176 RepID=K1KZ67_CECL9|nr:hypothetical protein [Cecembia lonarensis]EKB47756.1 hypothetical protein B879_03635 [Cecembia lonarensis LW9]
MKKSLKLFLVFMLSLSWVGTGYALSENPSNPTIENDAQEVIARYIAAVGGKEKVAQIKNSVMTMEAELQGMKIQIKGISDQVNGRLLQETIVMGNVASRTVLANGKGTMMAMGQESELPADMLQMMKVQTYVFPEEHYETLGYKVLHQGMDEIDGEAAHRLVITANNGFETVEYYSVASGLKLRTSSEATGDVTYSDYQEVEGIKYPMRMTIKNPMMPMALETKVVSIAFNQELSDEDFK